VSEPGIVHEVVWEGRTITFSWFPAPAQPPLAGRVYGVCTTTDGRIPLVRVHEDDRWFLPGGGVHPGESIADALGRELDEELGAVISASEYLGYQSAHDPENPFGAPQTDYHLFFWCRVAMHESFVSAHEVAEVRFVSPDNFRETLAWGSDPKSAALLDLALRADTRFVS
jgi:8-oxo-dGTP pyrophosphatase MutT (NUDIX family)